ncbi:MAG TPA: T9SS type A sorting domain-containing protein [Bacteroidales bacterium]|nr:T9SS type A sorting domain-containing protein [Bacteroidales bacterium]HPI29824.1 T9SS type A sorting domain-containing protein [Bacteroidales bacterium]HQN15550.1 T9SS type A sorting domain-containing protein [Bacteroidales bacterium]HQP15357.1 T9SS type A sorting domain-containing protein [Bacteroidales bacterium]
MKKTYVLIMLIFSIGFTKANPISPPPIISELYIINDSTWFLEIVFLQGNPFINYANLDGFRITTSMGTSYLKNGIPIINDSIIVITQDSLQSPLQIFRNGDFILIKDISGLQLDQIYFGNISGTQMSAPLLGQSIVNLAHPCWDTYLNQPGTVNKLVKDNHPTIGYSPFQPFSAIGIFTGVVYDSGHQPVAGIKIGNSHYIDLAPTNICANFYYFTLTDSLGSFTSQEYSGSRYVELFFQSSSVLADSIINIEPDSINYYEFTIDTLLTGVQQNYFQTGITLLCYPNPSTGETFISFSIPAGIHYSKAIIKIYDSNSEMVRILPVNTSNSQNNYSIKWDGLCYNNATASGTYYCNLELDGRKSASNKIIIIK